MTLNLKKLFNYLISREFFIIVIKEILFISILSLLFLLDDYIFKLFNDVDKAKITAKMLILSVGLSTGISLVKNKKIIYSILGVLFVMETCQLVYLAYFGTYLHPTVVPLIVTQIPEITETGFGMFGKVYYGFLAVIIQYLLIFLFIRQFKDKVFSFKFSWIILILFISLIPMRALRETSIARLVANPNDPSIYNSMKIFSGYFFNVLPGSLEDQNNEIFQDYEVEKGMPLEDDATIILIYGESFSYYRQGLYGYNKDTTPNLSKLAKTDKNFAYAEGISGAIATQQSIPIFFNLQREPKNYKMQVDMNLNLFKLAKDQGFKTFFISAQNSGLTNGVGRQFIDEFETAEDIQDLFDRERDEALLDTLKTKLLSKRNFIVLHQRNLHTPYEKNYEYRKSDFNKFTNAYDNAILYNDYLLSEIINYAKNNIKGPLYIFITSDHNELTGQDGMYGHGILTPKSGDVPMIIYTNKKANPKVLKEFKNMFYPTHNQFGMLMAEIFGYKIKNNNTPDNIYFINGNDTLARFGYIKVIKNFDKKEINYQMIDENKIEKLQQERVAGFRNKNK